MGGASRLPQALGLPLSSWSSSELHVCLVESGSLSAIAQQADYPCEGILCGGVIYWFIAFSSLPTPECSLQTEISLAHSVVLQVQGCDRA